MKKKAVAKKTALGAKKQMSSGPKRKERPSMSDGGRQAVLLRTDADVHDSVRLLSDRVGVSLNQVLHGLVRWAAQHGIPGEAVRDKAGFLRSREIQGCVWFGKLGCRARDMDEHLKELIYQMGDEPEDDKGKYFFKLDFTERRVIVDEGPGSF